MHPGEIAFFIGKSGLREVFFVGKFGLAPSKKVPLSTPLRIMFFICSESLADSRGDWGLFRYEQRIMHLATYLKGPLIIHASGWGRREVGWVNDFLGSLKVGCIIFLASQRLDGILLIALCCLGSYYFIVHKVG